MQLGHRLPVATASWLPLLFSRAATWMTRILSGAWDHTHLCLSNIWNTLYSEAHWSRFRRRKKPPAGLRREVHLARKKGSPTRGSEQLAAVSQGYTARNW